MIKMTRKTTQPVRVPPDDGDSRTQIGRYLVDWVGVEPTLAEVLAVAEPDPTLAKKEEVKDAVRSMRTESLAFRAFASVVAGYIANMTKAIRSGKPADANKLSDIDAAKLMAAIVNAADGDLQSH